MANIHTIRRLGSNQSGDKAGIELPKDDLRLEGLLDEDDQLVERPEVSISRVGDGQWKIELLDRHSGRRPDGR